MKYEINEQKRIEGLEELAKMCVNNLETKIGENFLKETGEEIKIARELGKNKFKHQPENVDGRINMGISKKLKYIRSEAEKHHKNISELINISSRYGGSLINFDKYLSEVNELFETADKGLNNYFVK